MVVDSRTLAVLSAGVHEPSTTTALATDLARATVAAAEPLGIHVATTMVEIRDVAGDLALVSVDRPMPPALVHAIDLVTKADAVIAVTPIFAASFSGLFKSFFDALAPRSLVGMPMALGATGGSVRHSLALDHALRPLMAYFRADVVPTGVFVAPDDSRDDAERGRLHGRIARAGAELAAALSVRRRMTAPDGFAAGAGLAAGVDLAAGTDRAASGFDAASGFGAASGFDVASERHLS